MWWMAAAGVASAIIGNEANRKSANASSSSLRKSAQAKLKAADSVLYADLINRSQLEGEGRQVQSQQLTAFASSGVDITSGSVISTMAETESQILKNNYLSKMKATADADLLKADAENLRAQAKQVQKNQSQGAFQNIISGAVGGFSG